MQVTQHHSCRVSPFGHPRIHARLAAPRGISQPPTSFIGSQCQGIHHAPLNTYNTKPKKMSHHPHTTPTPKKGRHHVRVSEKFALQQKHTTHSCAFSMLATTIHKSNTTPHHQSLGQQQDPHPPQNPGREGRHTNPPTRARAAGLLSQSPIVCLMILSTGISLPAP